jgi:hypothetical protein
VPPRAIGKVPAVILLALRLGITEAAKVPAVILLALRSGIFEAAIVPSDYV